MKKHSFILTAIDVIKFPVLKKIHLYDDRLLLISFPPAGAGFCFGFVPPIYRRAMIGRPSGACVSYCYKICTLYSGDPDGAEKQSGPVSINPSCTFAAHKINVHDGSCSLHTGNRFVAHPGRFNRSKRTFSHSLFDRQCWLRFVHDFRTKFFSKKDLISYNNCYYLKPVRGPCIPKTGTLMFLKHKPAVKLLLPFVLGILTAKIISFPPVVLFVILICLGVLICFFYRFCHPCVFVFLFVAGNLRFGMTCESPPNSIRYFGDLAVPVGIEGVIAGPVEKRGDDRVFILAVDTVWVLTRPYPAAGKVRVTFGFPANDLIYGDRIVAKGSLRLPPGERNPGGFNYAQYLASRRIFGLFYSRGPADYLILERGNGSRLLQRTVYPVRRWMIHVIESTLDGEEAALLKGLLVASKDDSAAEMKEAFSNAGVIHVLAVSGLHVGFILLGLSGLFKMLAIPEPFKSILVVAGLFFYAALTGMQAPVMRASIMASIIQFGRPLQRPADIFNSLAVAAFIILLVCPRCLFQAGFQLSFCAVLSIVLIYRQFSQIMQKSIQKWQERDQHVYIYLSGLFMVSLAAQIGTLPLIMYYFGKIPLVSLPANLVVVPLVGLIVALGFISVLGAVVYWPVGAIYAGLNWLFLKLLIGLVDVFSALPCAFLHCSRPSLLFFILYFLLITLFVLRKNPIWIKRLVFAILFTTAACTWYNALLTSAGVRVTFFDVGQGDAALFEFPGGKTMLVDAGESTGAIDYGERVIGPYLRRNGHKRIDVLVVTHPHSDHEGGVPFLLQHFSVGLYIHSGVRFGTELHARIDSLCHVQEIAVRHAACGDTLGLFLPATVKFYWPTRAFVEAASRNSAELNNASVVMGVTYGRMAFLLAGDAEIEAEHKMQPFGDLLRADVLKVGHHGSPTASSRAFIGNAGPRYAVVSVAKFNRFGLPADHILRRYKEKGCQVIRTDRNGAVVFFTDGRGLHRIR